MERGLRIVGFTFSGHGESTLNADVSNAKLQTQRSLLSELLAQYAIEDLNSDSESNDSDGDDDNEVDGDYADAAGEPAPVARQDTYPRSSPISIPYTESLANQRAKDAYRRLLYQKHVEQLYHQQQQQVQYQAQQQYLLQRQQQQVAQLQHRERPLQGIQQPNEQASQAVHASEQGRDDGVSACAPNPPVQVY